MPEALCGASSATILGASTGILINRTEQISTGKVESKLASVGLSTDGRAEENRGFFHCQSKCWCRKNTNTLSRDYTKS